MKKSEMIYFISDWLLTAAPETYQFQSSYGRRIDAEDLLELLEEAGMLPPPRMDGGGQTIFNWESED